MKQFVLRETGGRKAPDRKGENREASEKRAGKRRKLRQEKQSQFRRLQAVSVCWSCLPRNMLPGLGYLCGSRDNEEEGRLKEADLILGRN